MPNLTDSDLRDPSPPVPGARERAAVAARAHQLGRRRRILQGAGALGMVAAVAVGVAALTAGGTSSSPGGQRIAAAGSSGDDAPSGTATTTTPAPAVTTVPAPTPAPDPTPVVEAPVVSSDQPAAEVTPPAPAAPTTFTVSGTVSNIPEGTTLTLTLSGSGGTFTALAGPDGAYSISGVPAGSYDGIWEWVATDNSATAAGRGSVTVTGDTTFSFSV
jgi:hypothetical protein